jgi:hypothetical protein
MKNVINAKLQAIVEAVDEQTNRICSELSANYDGQNAAQAEFNTKMLRVTELRRQADELQANCGSVGLSLLGQLEGGEIVTGTPTPARRPKLVKSEQAVA